jgi:hypothetical protein
MGASPPANESNDSMPYFSLSAPSIPGDPVGGNGFVISRAGAVATLWHGLPEVVARSPDVVARSPGGYGTVSRRCGTVSRRLWHGLPEVVARSPGGCGTVSRPCHALDRRSPSPMAPSRQPHLRFRQAWSAIDHEPPRRPRQYQETFGQTGGMVGRPCHNRDRRSPSADVLPPRCGTVSRPCHSPRPHHAIALNTTSLGNLPSDA